MNQIPYNLLRISALAFMAFVIYGSLVPLEFRAIPFGEAIERFQKIPFLELGIRSRADWVANFLLFIPLSFFITGAFWSDRLALRVTSSILILLFCTLLTISIEFTQLYFPNRTVSQNDILAESIGGLVGILIWWKWGERLCAFYVEAREAKGAIHLAEKILFLYLLILFGYNLLPLDLTLSPVEIYNKWKSNRVILIPFASFKATIGEQIYEFLTDFAIWIPVSFLYYVTGKSAKSSFYRALGIAFLLEFLQIFVFTRLSDTTDLITAAIGAGLGILLAKKFLGRISQSVNQISDNATGTIVEVQRGSFLSSGIIVSFMMLLVIYWYPFDFLFDVDFIKIRINDFFTTPLQAYYSGSEYRAITQVFRKVTFFIPLAVFVAWYRDVLSKGSGGHFRGFLAVVLLILSPFVIEFGQLLLPEKSAQITDVLFEWVGCFIGYKGYYFVSTRIALPAVPVPGSQAEQSVITPSAKDDVISVVGKNPGVKTEQGKITRTYFFSPVLAVSALFWFAIVLISPLINPLMHSDYSSGLGFLSAWDQGDNPYSIYWIIASASCLVIAGVGSRLRRAKYAMAVLIWLFLLVLMLPMLIFIESLSFLFVLLATSIALISGLCFIKLFRKLPLPGIATISGLALIAAFILPLQLAAEVKAGLFDGLWLNVDQRLYWLLKSAVLFVPIGFLAGIMGDSRFYQKMAIQFAIAFMIVCLPLLAAAPGEAILNILALPVGIYIGTKLPVADGFKHA